MSFELEAKGLQHDLFLDLVPVGSAGELAVPAELEGLGGGGGRGDKGLLGGPLKLFALEEVLGGGVGEGAEREGGGVEVAHEAVGVVGPVEVDSVGLHQRDIVELWMGDYLIHISFTMQTRIDWTTGGLSFYDVDPPKEESAEQFRADSSVNQQFDPRPSR